MFSEEIAKLILDGLSYEELHRKAMHLMELNGNQARMIDGLMAAAQVPAWSVSQAEQDAMSADQWDAWKAALKAGSTASVPDGWKLVPVEPTEAMLEAAGNTEEIHNEWGEDLYVKNTEEVYQAMLAAAPDAPKDAP